MNRDSESKLLRGNLWASCAMAFGLGHIVLSQIEYGIVVALLLMLCGVIAKSLIRSRLERLHRDTRSVSSDVNL